ncbi:hypothetical protein MF406_03255 [Georgenia sp. TF02-10]|uniref:hypothetical protein n=1 Tax=Georgenia sp. TF02-10 TaxID=2917725 RepID=UPI001FA6D73C|nr:hypothetical protein [Georgenia sp. TF02-10]UNX55304.1 hypothetical protein MF406_03255 [Georgenia sp. TF02-10]
MIGWRRGLARAAAVLAVGGAVVGCAAAPDGGAASEVVTDFFAAVDGGDGAAACGMLAPVTLEELEDDEGQSCASAVLGGDVGPTLQAEAAQVLPAGAGADAVQAYGRQAQAVVGEVTVFLTRSGERWVISAAGCEPVPERPYRCALEGA